MYSGMFMSLLLAMYYSLFFIFVIFPSVLGVILVGILCCLCVLQYNFEGRYDLVRFVKTVKKAGLYVHLRMGPYVCAEWNFG